MRVDQDGVRSFVTPRIRGDLKRIGIAHAEGVVSGLQTIPFRVRYKHWLSAQEPNQIRPNRECRPLREYLRREVRAALRFTCSPSAPSTRVGNYIQSEGLGAVIQVIVYPDLRGERYGIGRYEDHPRFDFLRVQQEPDVHFAHKSGFMCKTTATDPDRLRALIAGAQVDVT